ncbi:MAG: hypothetical protein KDA75_05360 [Planctomycetaceae bacterium]|nr:hypothetical protein [Planctomycetaceae bacterium]
MWLAFHVAAVAIYPASILVPRRGLLSGIRDLFFERYMEGLYMVQGNRFFAPEPGPGTLVEWRIEHPDGTTTENTFPRREIKPRLLYHRYFMLSERVQDVGDEANWFRMYARHLAEQYDAERVTLTRVVHRLPTPEDIISGKRLEDDEFYDRNPLGSWTREELRQPYPEIASTEDASGDAAAATADDSEPDEVDQPAESLDAPESTLEVKS